MKHYRRTKTYCPDCRSSGEIKHDRLGTVRCPYCTKPKPSAAGVKLLTANEKRRKEQEALSSTVRVEDIKLPALPKGLISTDRVLARWGCDGTGMPSEDPDAYRESLPPPLDPATFTEVNRIVAGADKRPRRFVQDFYRSYNPADRMARKWSASPRQIRRIRVEVLWEFKAMFLKSDHADLVALIRFIPESN